MFLKLDFKNAFNMIDRTVMLQKVKHSLPNLYPFLSQCYSSISYLSFGEHLIKSQRGVQQGDPLGPALFCLTIEELTRNIKSEFNCWYLDDGSIADDSNVVLQDFENIIYYSKQIGLELNFEKCELISPSHPNQNVYTEFKKIAPGIKIVNKSKWNLLGIPLSEEGLSDSMKIRKESLQLISSRLNNIPLHVSFFLLKNCLAIPKLMYTLRCSPAWKSQKDLVEFDNTLRAVTEQITNNHFDDISWLQATLPVNLGGLGLRSASSLALPSFLASFKSVSKLIDLILPAAFSSFEDDLYNEGESIWYSKTQITLTDETKIIQKAWDRPLLDIASENLTASAITSTEKARLNAAKVKESGAWLNALPVAALGTLLDNDSFRIAIGLRLGLAICTPHRCICGSEVDNKGTHSLSCRKSSGRFSRHHQVNDLIKRAMVIAGIPAILEPVGTSRDDGKRPDGMTLIPWKCGKPLVWDFTCADTLAASHLAGAAAITSEKLKQSKYQNLGTNYHFQPVAVETFGVFGPKSLMFINEIGRRLYQATNEIRSTSFLIQRISLAIQRGNASSVFGTIPPSHSLEEIFVYPPFSKSYSVSICSKNDIDNKDSYLEKELHNKDLSTPPNISKSAMYPFDSIVTSPNPIFSNDENDHSVENTFSVAVHSTVRTLGFNGLDLSTSPKLTRSTISPSNSIYSSLNSSSLPRRSSDRDNHRIRDYSEDDSSGERSTNSFNTIRPLVYNTVTPLGLNGLKNIGNTCFMNSVIQCLSNTRWLLEYLRKDAYTRNINTSISSMKGALIKAFAEVIKELWSEDSSDRVVNTVTLKSQIQRFAPRFIGYAQQDAQEFLRYLLEGLHEDVNRITEKPKPIMTEIDEKLSDNEKAQESWTRYLRMDNSKIVDNFVGQLKSTLKCTYCGHCSVTFDPFWDLSLPIPQRTGQLRLSQCLDSFTREETLDGDEKPTCAKCKERRKCTKSLSIHKFPKILVIHLKRFSPMERFRGKLNVTIDFPLEGLDMSNYAADNVAPCRYSLYALSNHSGTTYSGHYTAYCRHPYAGTWHEYNDSRVSPISPRSLVSGEAYVLFYEQEGTKSHL